MAAQDSVTLPEQQRGHGEGGDVAVQIDTLSRASPGGSPHPNIWSTTMIPRGCKGCRKT